MNVIYEDDEGNQYWNPLRPVTVWNPPQKIQDEEFERIDKMNNEQFFDYVGLVLKAPIERIAGNHRVVIGYNFIDDDEGPSAEGENMLIAILTNIQHRLEGEQYFITFITT